MIGDVLIIHKVCLQSYGSWNVGALLECAHLRHVQMR